MNRKVLNAYVAGMCLLAVGSLYFLNWAELLAFSHRDLVGLSALALLGLTSESSALTHVVGKSSGTSSLTFLPVLACVLLFGPAATIIFLAVTCAVAESVIRKKEGLRVIFNVSQYIVSATIAGWIFTASGGVAIIGSLNEGTGFAIQLAPFVPFALSFLGFNHGAVTVAIALSQKKPFREIWKGVFGRSGSNILNDLLVCPVAIFVAFLYHELWVWGFLVSLLPLMFIRYSYLSNFRLQQANRDLLQVLVKAIETRDPYTSGHSLRVSDLAARIATALNLPARKVESISTAALLHDIGKIDIVYEEILRKPGHLSEDERDVIESHVVKGVELLTSLSSFNADVIGAVHHHHEWFNGEGYPDNLKGLEIPIGARIIKICDAVDAMLSDRSYRKALSLHEVRLQLRSHSGSQFDGAIVKLLLQSSLLEGHAEYLRDQEEVGTSPPSEELTARSGKQELPIEAHLRNRSIS